MPKGLKYVRQVVDQEGFDYAFRHKTDFSEVKDEEFHRLRQAYVDAANELAEYTGCDEELDEEDEDDETDEDDS
jgi:hypothetical protein